MRDRNQINKKGPEPKLKPLQGLHPHPLAHDRNLRRGRVPPHYERQARGPCSSSSTWLVAGVTDIAAAWAASSHESAKIRSAKFILRGRNIRASLVWSVAHT